MAISHCILLILGLSQVQGVPVVSLSHRFGAVPRFAGMQSGRSVTRVSPSVPVRTNQIVPRNPPMLKSLAQDSSDYDSERNAAPVDFYKSPPERKLELLNCATTTIFNFGKSEDLWQRVEAQMTWPPVDSPKMEVAFLTVKDFSLDTPIDVESFRMGVVGIDGDGNRRFRVDPSVSISEGVLSFRIAGTKQPDALFTPLYGQFTIYAEGIVDGQKQLILCLNGNFPYDYWLN